MKAINIKWDDENIKRELPLEVEIPDEITDPDKIADWLSDTFGYCHKGFDLITGKLKYYIFGIGYDQKDRVADHEEEFGSFDTYEDAYKHFIMLQCRKAALFFIEAPDLHSLKLQLEECDETKNTISCINIKNTWDILNPITNK